MEKIGRISIKLFNNKEVFVTLRYDRNTQILNKLLVGDRKIIIFDQDLKNKLNIK